MYVYIYKYKYIYICNYVYIYISIYRCTYIYIHIHINIITHTHTHKHTHPHPTSDPPRGSDLLQTRFSAASVPLLSPRGGCLVEIILIYILCRLPPPPRYTYRVKGSTRGPWPRPLICLHPYLYAYMHIYIYICMHLYIQCKPRTCIYMYLHIERRRMDLSQSRRTLVSWPSSIYNIDTYMCICIHIFLIYRLRFSRGLDMNTLISPVVAQHL